MDATDFLSKILWDLSNLDESNMSKPLSIQLMDIRHEIAVRIGLCYQGDEPEDDRDSCSHCGEYHSMSGGCPNDDPDNDLSTEHDSDHDKGGCGCDLGMDPNTECPTCS